MKNVVDWLKTSKPGVEERQIRATEEKLGAVFPSEYKELVKKVNQPEIGDWELYPIKDEQNPRKTWDDVVRQNQDQRDEDMPSDFIAIGEDGTGNRIGFRVSKAMMQSQVFLWNHETGEMVVMAESLKEFVSREAYSFKSETAELGTFEVTSGELIVTDPCYGYDPAEPEEFQVVLSGAKQGKWTATVVYDEEEVVHQLIAYWGETEPVGEWTPVEQLVAVDSAQAGIFDLSVFDRDDVVGEVENVHDLEMDDETSRYYIACCDAVSSDLQGGLVPGGCVVMSGYGDGMYQVYYAENETRQMIAVMIDFLEGDEEE